MVLREAKDKVACVQDSCGLATFSLSTKVLQHMWAGFACDGSVKACQIKDLWLENPVLVGGKGRLDCELTLAAGRKALVKEGGEGLLLVQSLPVQSSRPASLLLKLASGHTQSNLALALLSALRANPQLPEVFDDLRKYLENHIEKWASLGRRYISFS